MATSLTFTTFKKNISFTQHSMRVYKYIHTNASASKPQKENKGDSLWCGAESQLEVVFSFENGMWGVCGIFQLCQPEKKNH